MDGPTEDQIWGKQYSRKLAGLVALQTDIAQDVAGRIRTRLSGADEENLKRASTQNSQAYQLYLNGRFHWNKRTPEGHKKAIEYFNQAIAIDPNFAVAYAGLADAYALYYEFDQAPPNEARIKAKETALKALSLN